MLFLFNRLKSKKQKNSQSPPNCPKDGSSDGSVFESELTSFAQSGSRDTLGEDGFFDLLSRFQGSRMDDQRCSLLERQSSVPVSTSPWSTLPVAKKKSPISSSDPRPTSSRGSHLDPSAETPEGNDFFAMLIKCQGSRLDDQRCAAPPPAARGLTVPDEDFLSLILRSQNNRMEEQRVAQPPGCSQSKPD
ncbi:unnamed protein product [Boreogadus saida]